MYELLPLVSAGSNITPVDHGIVDGLRAGCTVIQRQCAVGNLSASALLFNIIPGAQRVLLFDLGAFPAGEGDRPGRGVDAGQDYSAWIPRRQVAIQSIKQPGNIDGSSGPIGRCWNGHIEHNRHSARLRCR